MKGNVCGMLMHDEAHGNNEQRSTVCILCESSLKGNIWDMLKHDNCTKTMNRSLQSTVYSLQATVYRLQSTVYSLHERSMKGNCCDMLKHSDSTTTTNRSPGKITWYVGILPLSLNVEQHLLAYWQASLMCHRETIVKLSAGPPEEDEQQTGGTCTSARALATEAVPRKAMKMRLLFQAMSSLVSSAFSQNSSECSSPDSFMPTSRVRPRSTCGHSKPQNHIVPFQ